MHEPETSFEVYKVKVEEGARWGNGLDLSAYACQCTFFPACSDYKFWAVNFGLVMFSKLGF